MSATRFRATRMKDLDIGFNYGRKFEFYDGDGEPHDLTQYVTSLKVVFFDAADVQLDAFDCTVLTATADKTADSDGNLVANKCTFIAKPTGPAGAHYFHVVGDISGEKFQLGQPAKVTIHSGPPAP